jgi:hypothetical protein
MHVYFFSGSPATQLRACGVPSWAKPMKLFGRSAHACVVVYVKVLRTQHTIKDERLSDFVSDCTNSSSNSKFKRTHLFVLL